MIFEFKNLSQEEKDMLFAFEEENPDCFVREITASLDGYTALQLLTPENIASASKVLIAVIGMIGSIAVAKSSAAATLGAAKINASATLEAARINATTTLEAAKINLGAAQEMADAAEKQVVAATPECWKSTKEISVQLSNGEKKQIPVGASIEQIRQIVGYSEDT